MTADGLGVNMLDAAAAAAGKVENLLDAEVAVLITNCSRISCRFEVSCPSDFSRRGAEIATPFDSGRAIPYMPGRSMRNTSMMF